MSSLVNSTTKRPHEEAKEAPKRKMRKLGEPNYIQYTATDSIYASRRTISKVYWRTTPKLAPMETVEETVEDTVEETPRVCTDKKCSGKYEHIWYGTLMCMCQLQAVSK